MDKSGSFRVYMAITTKMAEDARLIHETSPLATHLLGRALTGTGLMGLMLREPGFKVTLQFKGDGPAQQSALHRLFRWRGEGLYRQRTWIFRPK